MIQRIQTVYLLAAALVLGLLVFVPYAVFGGDFGMASFNLLGGEAQRVDGLIIEDEPNLLFLIGVAASAFVLLVAIFLFRKRRIQILLVYLAMFALLAVMALMGLAVYGKIESYMTSNTALNFQAAKSWGLSIPVISLILAWLAARGIKRDEELVRSADRIR